MDNGEKEDDLSTWKMPVTPVFHKVVHIIHSGQKRILWKKEEQMCFLWRMKKPENSPFFFLRKILAER